jgi:peptidoglycan/xylan/chitin deacetylase (PgdA/CDA1 family)
MADTALHRHVPVLTYHSIDGSASAVSTAPAEFRRQMQALAAAGWRTLAPDEFLRGRRAGGWAARTFLLTFDDGYRNLLDDALAIAGEHAFRGVVFVATDSVGGLMPASLTPAASLLDWNGLRRVAAAGWTIGSHARTHRRLPALAPEEAAREMRESKTRIADEIGVAPSILAYPYGATSPAIERLAGEHYEAAFGTVLGRVSTASRPTSFERIDAYYLRGLPVAELDSAIGVFYLALRRAGRALRPRSL